jgi:hypothetical protein
MAKVFASKMLKGSKAPRKIAATKKKVAAPKRGKTTKKKTVKKIKVAPVVGSKKKQLQQKSKSGQK